MILYPIQKNWRYLAPVIAKVPGRSLKLGAEVFVQFQKKEMIGDKLPKRIVLFVTKKCNLKCRHCFYIPNVSSGREMSLGQIQKIADSAKNNFIQISLVEHINKSAQIRLATFPPRKTIIND